METVGRSFAPIRQGALGLGQGEELGALEVVEIGQTVKRKPLDLRRNREPSAVAGARRGGGMQLASVGMDAGRNFPYKPYFRECNLS
jgi:hypothetical protein